MKSSVEVARAPSADGSVLRVALDSVPIGIVVCDESGTVLFANRQIHDVFRYDSSELVGRPIDDLLPQINCSGVRDRLGRRKDGSQVPVEVGLTIAECGEDRLIVASVTDVSDRMRDATAVRKTSARQDGRRLGSQRLIVAESAATKRVLEQIESVASTTATVLLTGETGSGKEVFAQAIHTSSERHGRPMVTVNCGAIPPTLIESELFGRERGAYTGALARQIGRFEMAHESTIFLDEIGELPLDSQVKLLRVLQERVVERLGGNQSIKVDVRIIAATNRNLQRAVEDRSFREDLFYRLNVFPIAIPPLRERVEDITALVWTFVEEYATAFRKPFESISKESLAALKQYPWPGNVRELRNVIERAVIVAKGPRLVIDLPPASATPIRSTRLDDLETEQIKRVLESVGWRVRGTGGAAELLGIKPNTLDSRMAKLGIRRPPRDAAP
jgi:transcriptional regulator with PAS, ATPase and Fis domain